MLMLIILLYHVASIYVDSIIVLHGWLRSVSGAASTCQLHLTANFDCSGWCGLLGSISNAGHVLKMPMTFVIILNKVPGG